MKKMIQYSDSSALNKITKNKAIGNPPLLYPCDVKNYCSMYFAPVLSNSHLSGFVAMVLVFLSGRDNIAHLCPSCFCCCLVLYAGIVAVSSWIQGLPSIALILLSLLYFLSSILQWNAHIYILECIASQGLTHSGRAWARILHPVCLRDPNLAINCSMVGSHWVAIEPFYVAIADASRL